MIACALFQWGMFIVFLLLIGSALLAVWPVDD